MKTVLVVKPGTLSPLDKASLGEDDILVVETDEPESVRWLKPSETFDPDDMLRAAIYSIGKSTHSTKERFVGQLTILAKATKSAK